MNQILLLATYSHSPEWGPCEKVNLHSNSQISIQHVSAKSWTHMKQIEKTRKGPPFQLHINQNVQSILLFRAQHEVKWMRSCGMEPIKIAHPNNL